MPRLRPRLRLTTAVLVLAGLLFVGARPVGPLPALGGFLDPAHGVWRAAEGAELPREAEGSVLGLGADVRVSYDGRGVPHIFAGREVDAIRALGFVVARDRLFQMHVQTLASAGRLTELAGDRALPLDREMRRLGLTWAAERKLAAADPGTLAQLNAFSDGVNAYIATLDAASLPVEFRLLGTRPARWEPIHTVQLLVRMGWMLAHITPELEQAQAATLVGAAAAAALFPTDAPIQEPIQPNGEGAPRVGPPPAVGPGTPDSSAFRLLAVVDHLMPSRRALLADAGEGRPHFASNNWAVAPARSASGHAVLAGDPHLELTLPSIWYEVHLNTADGLDVYGVTIPGAPGVIIGFNRDVAWSFTNTGADVLDFYRETVDHRDFPTRYQLDGEWAAVDRRIEAYRDKGGAVVGTDTLYFTHRGPMTRQGDAWVSMRWTVLEPSNEARAFSAVGRTRSVAEYHEVMARHFLAPAQNIVTADRAGHVGIRSTGRFPIRADSGGGAVVRDGSRSASDWRGYLGPVQYPQAMDPAQGFVASANQQPVDPRVAPTWFGGSYESWRAMRINRLLRADSQVTVDDMRAFQTEPGSERAELFVPRFVDAARARAHARRPKLAEAARILSAWDRRYTRENRAAALFELAMREVVERTWDELLRPRVHVRQERIATPSSEVLATMLADSANPWWDDRRSAGRVETRDDILTASLEAALDSARARYGEPGGDGWAWSRVRHANIRHLLRLPALSELGIPVQGGPGTLWPSSGSGAWGPSWRMVVEMGPEVRAWGTYPGGQSGRPGSSRYVDRLARWRAGELDSLRFPRTPADLGAGDVTSTLVLRPAAGGTR